LIIGQLSSFVNLDILSNIGSLYAAEHRQQLQLKEVHMSELHLPEHAKMRLPNVDEALDIGYALHAADDPALEGKIQQQEAQYVYDSFRGLKAEPNSAEDAYLRCIHGIVLSHARGITRRKDLWIKDLQAAAKCRSDELDKIREAHWKNNGLNVIWILLKPLILGISGYLVAQLLGLILPEEVHQQTGTKLPSILVGLVFILIGRSITFLVKEAQRTQIETEFKVRSYQAILAYDLGKRQEYRLYRLRLCEAWLHYTGEEYPVTASYEMVMAGDIETREKMERQLRIYGRTALWLLGRISRLLRNKKRNGVSVETPVQSRTAEQDDDKVLPWPCLDKAA
jgi:hypothetical protein